MMAQVMEGSVPSFQTEEGQSSVSQEKDSQKVRRRAEISSKHRFPGQRSVESKNSPWHCNHGKLQPDLFIDHRCHPSLTTP